MEKTPQYLFVYGTLRPCLAGSEQQKITKEFRLVGPATISGVLYDLIQYPGVTPGPGVVAGDVLWLPSHGMLKLVDEYEGCCLDPPLYSRVTTLATLHSGKTVMSWVYYYCGSLVKARAIPGGDYWVWKKQS